MWVLILGILDALDTRMHYRGLQDHYQQQQERLRHEVDEYYRSQIPPIQEGEDA